MCVKCQAVSKECYQGVSVKHLAEKEHSDVHGVITIRRKVSVTELLRVKDPATSSRVEARVDRNTTAFNNASVGYFLTKERCVHGNLVVDFPPSVQDVTAFNPDQGTTTSTMTQKHRKEISVVGLCPIQIFRCALKHRYVRERVTDKLNLSSYQDHVAMLADTLQKKKLDHSGMDLEKSVVFMLSLGPKTVKWQYRAVRGEPDRSTKDLALTKREITRGEFNAALVNYPSDTSYPLGDCVCVINGVYWTIQTTWQRDHAFKLRTLLSLQTRLNLCHDVVLNLLFVNPAHHTTYVNRHRSDYLVKGEAVSKPILDRKKWALISVQDVATIWESTRVFVAFPKDNDWSKAIKTALNTVKVVNKD